MAAENTASSAKSKTKSPQKGVLTFFSETGTEGGMWAFQDANSIGLKPPDYGVWPDNEVWDATNPNRKGMTQNDAEVLLDGEWRPLPDPINADSDYVASSLFQGEGRGDREADKRLMEKYGFSIEYGAGLGTPRTQPQRPYGVGHGVMTRATVKWEDDVSEQRLSDSLLVSSRSYDGLHCLTDGDHLTIYEKDYPAIVLWEGVIELEPHDLFTESAHGMWIHADQKGWEREEWAKLFMEEYPAELTRA